MNRMIAREQWLLGSDYDAKNRTKIRDLIRRRLDEELGRIIQMLGEMNREVYISTAQQQIASIFEKLDDELSELPSDHFDSKAQAEQWGQDKVRIETNQLMKQFREGTIGVFEGPVVATEVVLNTILVELTSDWEIASLDHSVDFKPQIQHWKRIMRARILLLEGREFPSFEALKQEARDIFDEALEGLAEGIGGIEGEAEVTRGDFERLEAGFEANRSDCVVLVRLLPQVRDILRRRIPDPQLSADFNDLFDRIEDWHDLNDCSTVVGTIAAPRLVEIVQDAKVEFDKRVSDRIGVPVGEADYHASFASQLQKIRGRIGRALEPLIDRADKSGEIAVFVDEQLGPLVEEAEAAYGEVISEAERVATQIDEAVARAVCLTGKIRGQVNFWSHSPFPEVFRQFEQIAAQAGALPDCEPGQSPFPDEGLPGGGGPGPQATESALRAREQGPERDDFQQPPPEETPGPKGGWFRWVTKNDDRVRRGHRELHNKVFRWVDGAPVEFTGYGHFPKEPNFCRCHAEDLGEDYQPTGSELGPGVQPPPRPQNQRGSRGGGLS